MRFSSFGITPSESDALVMSVMIDASEPMLFFTWSDGKGSRRHVLTVFAIITSTSLTQVASNVTIGVRNRRVSLSGVSHLLLALCNLVRISLILPVK